jgi:hypothetical protein
MKKISENKSIRCLDCNGWLIDGGSAFVAADIIRDGAAQNGYLCELCLLHRLQKRAAIVNGTSGPAYQIHLPELGIFGSNPPRKPWTPPRPSRPLRGRK